MEAWSWILVVVALLLLIAGTLRYDLLLAALRSRLWGASREEPPPPPRGVNTVHHAAAHTGHVSPHGTGRRKPALHRGGRRH